MASQTGSASSAARASASVTDTVDKASAAVTEVVDTASRKGREVVQEAGEAWTKLDVVVRTFVREKPYTALALAGFAGFLYAAIRRG